MSGDRRPRRPGEEILVARHRDFVKSGAFRILSRVVGQGLVTSEGEVWLRQRRLIQPAFHRDHIAAYAVTMREQTIRMLERELDAVSGGADPSVADVTGLRYDDMVLSEALRLYPPASLLGREAARDTDIGGYRIARGDTVLVSPWTVHRDPRWFEQPDEFRPERWTPELAASLPKFAYFPFGGGPRGCVGAGFAKMEATILLSVIAKRFRLELMPDQEVVPEPSITLRPKYGLRMRLQERGSGTAAFAR